MNPWHAFFQPSLLVKKWLRHEQNWSIKTKLELDWFSYPHYAYALNQATIQAKRLGLDAISAVEFGVASGEGLVAMETIAAELMKENGVAIHVYGFDVGESLSASTDPRDLPYARKREPARVDRAALNAKLKNATLIAGDIRQTVPRFFADHSPPPVGFVSFDLGDYTSTAVALKLFDAPSDTRLPRAFAYFDNVIGSDEELHCEFVGELCAIDAFNRAHENAKLGRINGLRHKRVFHSAWTEQLFVLHDLAHPRYGDYTGPDADRPAPSKD